jgi:hypothetical protein
MADLGMPPIPGNGIITGTSPASQASPTVQDASQRCPAASVPTNPMVQNCNDMLKASMTALLVGANGNACSVSASDLAEKLYAAAPETYED